MSKIIRSISGVLERCGTRGKAYPTTVGCATAFALVCILQIQFDLSKYNFPSSTVCLFRRWSVLARLPA